MVETRYVIGFGDVSDWAREQYLEPGVGDGDVSLSASLNDAAKHKTITDALNALVAASRKRNLTQYSGPDLIRIKKNQWEIDEVL